MTFLYDVFPHGQIHANIRRVHAPVNEIYLLKLDGGRVTLPSAIRQALLIGHARTVALSYSQSGHYLEAQPVDWLAAHASAANRWLIGDIDGATLKSFFLTTVDTRGRLRLPSAMRNRVELGIRTVIKRVGTRFQFSAA